MNTLPLASSLRMQRASFGAALYCVALAAFVASVLPNGAASSSSVHGLPSTFKMCGRSCDEGIQVQDKRFACSANLFGPAYHCPQTFQPTAEATATYFPSSSLLSVIGISERTNLLVRLEQAGQLVFVKSPTEYRSQALSRSWSFYALFAVVFCVLLRFPYFRKSKASATDA
jgi:hypothetical protein